jgi:formylglycine-generating enzyme required for sulfatase activity
MSDMDFENEMILVPGGEFLYGPENKKVYLPDFYISKYCVSVAEYARFLKATGYNPPVDWEKQLEYPKHPVVNVSWYDANAFCEWVGGRLPTEEEWEKAARGTDGRIYPWGNIPPTPDKAHYNRSWKGYQTLADVDAYPEGDSPYGVRQMAGNVWEWTSTEYRERR